MVSDFLGKTHLPAFRCIIRAIIWFTRLLAPTSSSQYSGEVFLPASFSASRRTIARSGLGAVWLSHSHKNVLPGSHVVQLTGSSSSVSSFLDESSPVMYEEKDQGEEEEGLRYTVEVAQYLLYPTRLIC
ncbi:hypothetical protein CRENBAI_014234 [Crenichthys baileyi]|uniref:Uncharacterized protein n=1 Tax=Crenichthys baileyi TaxID=28760 RepID=A0AAV9SQ37_9TELE